MADKAYNVLLNINSNILIFMLKISKSLFTVPIIIQVAISILMTDLSTQENFKIEHLC
jgi:hypothetical protein